jgi:hypothetical protein
MRRRQKFVLASILLALGLVAIQLVPLQWRPIALFIFALLAYILGAWSMFDNLDGVEWLTIVPLPSFYGLSVAAFYFLLPESWIARTVILGIFGLGMYALFLAGNIFTIAKVRSIQLLKAAQATLFFFCLIAALLAFNTMFSLGLRFYWNGLIAGAVSALLSFSFYWSIRLEQKLSHEVRALTIRTGTTIGLLAAIMSFFPANLWPLSLLLMTAMYTVLGLSQSALEEKLFTNTVREYAAVFIGVCVVFFAVMTWK